MNDTERRALHLIASNPGARDLLERGHALINAGVPGLLRDRLIAYDASRRSGYRLTNNGRGVVLHDLAAAE